MFKRFRAFSPSTLTNTNILHWFEHLVFTTTAINALNYNLKHSNTKVELPTDRSQCEFELLPFTFSQFFFKTNIKQFIYIFLIEFNLLK